MNDFLTVTALTRAAWQDFRSARRPLFIYDVLFKVAEAWVLVPAVALFLAVILSWAGHVAVSNQDLLAFLLTPPGLLCAALLGTVAVALLLFEQAGILALVALTRSGERTPFKRMLRAASGNSLRVLQLAAVQLALLAMAFAPFVLLALLTYAWLLSEHDIYFYVKERPPVFWAAAGIGGALAAAALAVGACLYVRWAFALPILLFEHQSPRAALRASRERGRGASWRIGSVLLGWLIGVLMLGAGVEAGFRLAAAAVLDSTGDRPLILMALLLAQGGILGSLSLVLAIGFGLLTRRLYLGRNQQLGLRVQDRGEAAPSRGRAVSPWHRPLAWLGLPLLLLAPLALWASLSRYAKEARPVEITAHRGHARAAPENTLSAMRKAIESGADFAEMDVQLTADGKIVLLHDRDFKRVSGVARRLDELTYDEVRRLDVGSWFDPAFAGERVPTLAEVIALCRGKLRLNIELKFFGPDRKLARAVAELLREEKFESECIVTSLDYDGLREAKRHNPCLRTGLIVAYALGDVSRLEVDALSVRADFLSDGLLRASHRLGREVHVWTVNDARQMFVLMKRGVDNIITSDPDLGIHVRNEWAGLTAPERLVLASRLLLGLDP
jgi:glycerophosphoryl diester phosphodiesterase